MRAIVRLTAAASAALIGSLALAVTAFGHAELLSTQPREGQVLKRAPRAVVLTFNEGIDPALVRLQVTDAEGRRVDRGEMFNPGGREEVLAVRLAPELAGTLVARFRVVSEDGHPVAKRLSFRVRQEPADQEAAQSTPAPTEEPPPPSSMPADESDHVDAGTGDVTDASFAATRAVGYLAIALSIGGALFVFVAWLPALAQVATGRGEWVHVSAAFAKRLRQIVLASVVVGLVATALAIGSRPPRRRACPSGRRWIPTWSTACRRRGRCGRGASGSSSGSCSARSCWRRCGRTGCRRFDAPLRGGGHRDRSRAEPVSARRAAGRGDRARSHRSARRP